MAYSSSTALEGVGTIYVVEVLDGLNHKLR